MSRRLDASGPHAIKPGGARVFRGTRKRVARIRMRDHMSVFIWAFIAFVVLLLVVGVPWMIRHSGPMR